VLRLGPLKRGLPLFGAGVLFSREYTACNFEFAVVPAVKPVWISRLVEGGRFRSAYWTSDHGVIPLAFKRLSTGPALDHAPTGQGHCSYGLEQVGSPRRRAR
jgi:hypothetical protein